MREARLPPSRIESQRPMRRTKPAVIAAALAALALGVAPAALGQEPANGGFGASEPGDTERRGDQPALLVRLRHLRRRLRRRRERASSSSSSASGAAARRPSDAEGPQIHGNTRLEIIWTIIPAVILVGIAVVVLARTSAVQATAATARTSSSSRSRATSSTGSTSIRTGRSRSTRSCCRSTGPSRSSSSSLRREPQLVGARAHRKARRHPGPDERAPLHADAGRDVRGPLRRALRDPARGHADHRRGRLAGRVRRAACSSSPARTSPGRPSSRLGRESWERRLRQVPRPRRRRRHRPADRQEQRRSSTRSALTELLDDGQDTPGRRELHAARRPRLARVPGAGPDRVHQVEPAAGSRRRSRSRAARASGRPDRDGRPRPGATAASPAG